MDWIQNSILFLPQFSLCIAVGAEQPSLPWKGKVLRRIDDGSGESYSSETVEKHDLLQYFEAVDLAVESIKERFDQSSYAVYHNLEELLLKGATGRDVLVNTSGKFEECIMSLMPANWYAVVQFGYLQYRSDAWDLWVTQVWQLMQSHTDVGELLYYRDVGWSKAGVERVKGWDPIEGWDDLGGCDSADGWWTGFCVGWSTGGWLPYRNLTSFLGLSRLLGHNI